MDGEVIYFDADRGIGFITGRDGNRYVFDKADLRGTDRIAKGAKVGFSVEGDRARLIRQTGGRVHVPEAAATPGAAPGTASAGSVPTVGGGEVAVAGDFELPDEYIQEPGPGLGVFGYFRRCVTANYANFRGRARRKEFWSFALMSIVLILAAMFVGLVLDFMVGNMREVASDADFSTDGAPWLTFFAGGVVWVALIVPSIAVTVRRIHDIGLSGWFFLLNFIPSVGGLIVFVFMLIPTQRHPNKWGPAPAGVRI